MFILMLLTLIKADIYIASQSDSIFQTPVHIGEHTPLDGVVARLNQVTILKADFKQEKRLKILRRPLTSSGTFLFSREHGVYWHTVNPFDNVFIVTDQTIYQKNPDQEPLKIETSSKPIVSGFTEAFLSVFTGDAAVLEDKFDIYFQGDEKAWTIALKPKGTIMKKMIDHMVLSGGEHLENVRITEASGDQTDIHFENVDGAATSLSPAEIQFFDI